MVAVPLLRQSPCLTSCFVFADVCQFFMTEVCRQHPHPAIPRSSRARPHHLSIPSHHHLPLHTVARRLTAPPPMTAQAQSRGEPSEVKSACLSPSLLLNLKVDCLTSDREHGPLPPLRASEVRAPQMPMGLRAGSRLWAQCTNAAKAEREHSPLFNCPALLCIRLHINDHSFDEESQLPRRIFQTSLSNS